MENSEPIRFSESGRRPNRLIGLLARTMASLRATQREVVTLRALTRRLGQWYLHGRLPRPDECILPEEDADLQHLLVSFEYFKCVCING